MFYRPRSYNTCDLLRSGSFLKIRVQYLRLNTHIPKTAQRETLTNSTKLTSDNVKLSTFK